MGAISGAQPGPVASQEPTVAVAAAQVSGELPEGLPDALPLWPGATVISGEAAGEAVLLTLDAREAYDDVVAGVSVGFERAGWTVTEDDVPDSVTVLDVQGDGLEGVVTVSETEDGVQIDYLLTRA